LCVGCLFLFLCFFICFFCVTTVLLFFFFFSSGRRHTRYWRDWSSDVCSSDLSRPLAVATPCLSSGHKVAEAPSFRSEERRVGKERRSRWSPPPQTNHPPSP